MCANYAPQRASRCSEEDAPEVRDKTSANFCDYYSPNPGAYAPAGADSEAAARRRLQSLFGSTDPGGGAQQDEPDSDPLSAAEAARRKADDLFKP